MSKSLEESLWKRIAHEEQRGRYLVPSNRAERQALERRVRAGMLVSPYKDMFVRPEYLTQLSARARTLHTVKALAALHPDWTFCFSTAALLHGLQVSNKLLQPIDIAIEPTGNRRRASGIAACHVVPHQEALLVAGVRATALLQTLLDCACAYPFAYGLAIVDSALHWKLTTKEEVTEFFLQRGKGRHGIETARKVVAYCDGRSDNGGESIARAMIIELGFAVPELQVEIYDPMEPSVPKVADYYWRRPDGHEIIGELDGMGKYQGVLSHQNSDASDIVQAFSRERIRESHLNLTGATVIRFTIAQAQDEDYMLKLLSAAGVPLR